LALTILGYALLKSIHDVYLFGYVLGDIVQQEYFHNTFYNISIALFYTAFSIALELSREWYEQRELIRQIEVDKLNTELQYLKAQINPHFLFNSINTIYFQIEKQNKTAREMLSAFSDMLRYQLYECNDNEIAIEKEVNYIRNYVDLQRMRKDENYNIALITSPEVAGFSIAPLMLIPFIENAFKHVSHMTSDNKIVISLAKQAEVFSLHVFNTKDLKKAATEEGIGLKNVKRRLELIYNGRHTLSIKSGTNDFEVDLSIRV
jgi:two-component system, LytTR family, sensor kinase